LHDNDADKLQGFTSESNQSRRWLARYIDKLCNDGILEKVNLPRKGSKASVRAVRLLKSTEETHGMYIALEYVNCITRIKHHNSLADVRIDNTLLETAEENHIGELEDVPLQYEVYRHIIQSGTKGITNIVS
jgi:hypothetical protein